VSSGARIEYSFIIAGLDPAIHLLGKKVMRSAMDPRVEPAGDGPNERCAELAITSRSL
jgi:hypothetical protein